MFGHNRYGSETCYEAINEDIDEEFSKLRKEKPNLTTDEVLEMAIRRCVVIEHEIQIKYYVADYREWAARKAFGGL